MELFRKNWSPQSKQNKGHWFPRSSRWMTRLSQKAARFLLFLFVTLFFTNHIFAADEKIPPIKNYAIFIDAGSLGTRLYIYEYSPKEKLSTTVPKLTEFYTTRSTPGIATFSSHLKDLPNYLKPLFDSAEKVLRTTDVPLDRVPLYLFGTAGMRSLKEDEQEKIYDFVRKFISQNYPFQIEKNETVNGSIEGLYSWMDVNYLAENFNHSSKKSKQKTKRTLGIIDMGSGATHIVFSTSGYEKSPDEFHVNINHKKYIVFSKSFLGLGQDTARLLMNTYPEATACYPKNYLLSPNAHGDFNPTKCTIIYHDILEQYGLKRGQIPTRGSSFIGINGFFYTYRFFGGSEKQDHARIETKVSRICHKTWHELLAEYPKDTYLSTYCANAIYTIELVYHTYQIQGSQLKILDKINGKTMNWIRGAALYNLFQ